MTGHLPKQVENFKNLNKANIAIIASSWHSEIIDQMINSSKELLEKLDASSISVHSLPGSLELPLAAKILFSKNDKLDAIIAFGVILKGDTTHNETVEREVANGFTLVSQEFSKPIINEVIGVSDIKFAAQRAQSKGIEAVYAVSEFLNWQHKDHRGNYETQRNK